MARAAAFDTFRFKSPYKRADHGSTENGLNSSDTQTEYKELRTDINEAVAGFAYLYAYGVSKLHSSQASRDGRSIT